MRNGRRRKATVFTIVPIDAIAESNNIFGTFSIEEMFAIGEVEQVMRIMPTGSTVACLKIPRELAPATTPSCATACASAKM